MILNMDEASEEGLKRIRAEMYQLPAPPREVLEMLVEGIELKTDGWRVEIYLPVMRPKDAIVLGEAVYSSKDDSWTVEIFDENIEKLHTISEEDYIDPDPMIR